LATANKARPRVPRQEGHGHVLFFLPGDLLDLSHAGARQVSRRKKFVTQLEPCGAMRQLGHCLIQRDETQQ
jgi:hypothetical protein